MLDAFLRFKPCLFQRQFSFGLHLRQRDFMALVGAILKEI